jgi:hypothetical protein
MALEIKTFRFLGKKEWFLSNDFFLKVSLDHFEPNLYISTNNRVYERSYAFFIKARSLARRYKISG